MGHYAQPELLGYEWVTGIKHPVKVWGPACTVCGRPVRRMTGLGPDTFWHAGRKPLRLTKPVA